MPSVPDRPDRRAVARLQPEDDLPIKMTQAYYRVLNQDPDASGFATAWQVLVTQLTVPRRAHPDLLAVSTIEGEPAEPVLREFVDSWHLPRRSHGGRIAVNDLVDSVWYTQGLSRRNPQFHVELRVWSWAWRTPSISGIIVPSQPEPFRYDPCDDGPVWLKAEARRQSEMVRRSVVEQGTVLDREARALGYRALPARYRATGELDRLALRLYRRALLEWPYERVAADEQKADPHHAYVDPNSVKVTVTQWSRRLGVRLSLQPGRPRK